MTLFVLTLMLAAAQPVPVAKDSLLAIRVNKDSSTLLSGLSHNHVMRASEFDARASLDPTSGECSVKVTVPVKALEVDPPKLREEFGLKERIDEGDRKTIRENMLDADQLDAERYPTITLQSTRCRFERTTLSLQARLTLRGKTRSVRLELERVVAPDGRTVLVGTLPIKGTDYGLEPYSAGLGSLKNADEMTIHLELYAQFPKSE